MDVIKNLFGIIVLLGVAYLGLILIIRIMDYIFLLIATRLRKQGVRPKQFWHVLLIVFCLVFFVKTVSFPLGYCKSQGKYLSDDDFKSKAMALVNPLRSHDQETINEWSSRTEDPVLYSVYRDREASWFTRLLDNQEITVYAHAPSGRKGVFVFDFDVCGRYLRQAYDPD